MKTKIIFLILAVFLKTACKNSNENISNYSENQGYYSELDDNQTSSQKNEKGFLASMFNNKTREHSLKDARTGLVVNTAKYPANWKVISKPVYTIDQKIPMFLMQIEGPNNLKTFNTPIKLYIDYSNPQMAQWMRQYSSTSSMMRPYTSNQQIMQEEVNNRMAESGFQLIGQKQVPRAKNYIRNILNKTGAQQAQLDHYATEWTNNKGQKALVTLIKIAMEQHISINNSSMVMWFYSLDYVFVDENKFENTINQLLDATESTKENPQWQEYMQQLSRLRMQKAQEQHRISLHNRQAAFDAHQRKMKGIWAAQDANHASFMKKNFGAGSDVAQKQFINMINEEETVYNPSTGKNYQVNAGSLQYWMDSDGNYIKNDNLFYNPNGDINLNNREWTKVKNAF